MVGKNEKGRKSECIPFHSCCDEGDGDLTRSNKRIKDYSIYIYSM